MPVLAPASHSPLLGTTLPITPTNGISIASATPSLDDMIEYLDVDGVPRRSETLTRRMILRGHTNMKAAVLDKDDQAHRSLQSREEEMREREKLRLQEEREREARMKPNADFKRKCKAERQQWIDEADELIVTRLQYMYDSKLIAAGDEVVDVTESCTEMSPSKKTQAFIDPDGNLRRKSAPQVVVPPPVVDPAARRPPAAEPGASKKVDGDSETAAVQAAEAVRSADQTSPAPAPAGEAGH